MVSVDDPDTNRAFAESLDADFPLLSDPARETATAYGVLRNYGFGAGQLAARWTFYIGPEGRILKIDTAVNPSTAGEDVVAALAELNVPKRR